jgi:hypothetical protein
VRGRAGPIFVPLYKAITVTIKRSAFYPSALRGVFIGKEKPFDALILRKARIDQLYALAVEIGGHNTLLCFCSLRACTCWSIAHSTIYNASIPNTTLINVRKKFIA